MSQKRFTVTDAVSEGAAFARSAWRRLWAVQALAMFGTVFMFVGARGQLTPSQAYDTASTGFLVALASWAPLWGSVYRLAVGGRAAAGLGPGGLQFGRIELRFLALALAVGLAVVLAILPMIAVSAGLFVALADAGDVQAGSLGLIRVSFVTVACAWIAAAVGLGYVAARFGFAPSATVREGRLVLIQAWMASRGRGWAVAGAWLLAQAPTVLAFALIILVDPMVRQDPAWEMRNLWPLPEAFAGGLLLGLVAAFVQAPLTAGVLAALHQGGPLGEAALDGPVPDSSHPEALPV